MDNAGSDPLAALLFGRKHKLVNLKLCRGDAPDVTEAELRNEAHHALSTVEFGMSDGLTDFPEDRNAKRVNIVAFA